MQKWEYCIVFAHLGHETWVVLPSGKRMKAKNSLIGVLNTLGEDGWEAVNLNRPVGGTLVRNIDNVGVWDQILLKRPIEE